MQQKIAPIGCVRQAWSSVPLRAVGECEAQLTSVRPSKSDLSLCSAGFRRPQSSYGEIRLPRGCRRVVVASFPTTALGTEPHGPPWVRAPPMSRRSRPQYRSDLGWLSGVALLGALTRSARPAQGFTRVRCCGSPRASFPRVLSVSRAVASGSRLPPTAPQRTSTSNPAPMPGAPSRCAAPPLRSARFAVTAPFRCGIFVSMIFVERSRPRGRSAQQRSWKPRA